MINLEGKTILITGASSGIGRAISQIASNFGARLILLGRNLEKLKNTYDSLSGSGHSYFSVDVTNPILIIDTLKSAISPDCPISGFVHCAGVDKTALIKASTPQVFKEVFETNVFAGFEIVRILVYNNMFDLHGASIVFISSIMGKLGEIGKLVYSSSKSALLAGAKSIALELAPKRIRCNCVLPGIVLTEMVSDLFDTIPEESMNNIIKSHPLGLGHPEDVGHLVSYLLSDYARWITGSDYIIDGGYSAR